MHLYNFNKVGDISKKPFKVFEDTILGKKPFIMFVHASFCGHCRAMYPHYKVALDEIKSQDVIIVEISDDVFRHFYSSSDSDVGTLLKETVQGFPTLCYVPPVDQKHTIHVTHFNDERDANNIKRFLKKGLQVKSVSKPLLKPIASKAKTSKSTNRAKTTRKPKP